MTTAEKTAIVSLCVAAYAAVVSTANSIIQFVNHRKDRADILVRVQRNMVQTDKMDQKYTIITAVNRGKRPVTVQGFAARQLDTNTNLLFLDIRPQVPRVLNEAESIAAWVPWVRGTDDLPNVETFFVYDSINREFCCHVVPWHRRLKSRYRRKHEADQPKNSSSPTA